MAVAFRLKRKKAMTTAKLEELPTNQQHWWLRLDGEFVRIPDRPRGDAALDVVLQLAPGSYVLGVGPARGGVRENILVEATEPAEAAAVPAAPAFAKGSLGPIVPAGKTFVITGDLDAMERDAAKAWLVGLGAKVSTSVSAKTDYLLVGREPGPKKLEKAAELGTRVVSEPELRAALGLGTAPAVAEPKPTGNLLQTFLAKIDRASLDTKHIEKLVGPSHFRDLGLHEKYLWGVSLGPRGGEYHVFIDLADRPRYAMQCNCPKGYAPCQHGYALLFTAERHFVPPAEPPEGHRERSRYTPGYE